MSTEFVEDNKYPGKAIQVHDSIHKAASEDDSLNDVAVDDYINKFLDMSNEARDNDKQEKAMPFKEGIKTFPKAVMWSVILSTALVMEGYDIVLLNALLGMQSFNKKFGNYYPELDEYQVPAKWQTGLNMAYQCGSIIGLYIAGHISDVIGYKKTLLTALISSVGLIFIQFFAPNISVLLVAYVLLGINWGSYQTITVTYASEVAPTPLRVYLTTYVNMCWVFGQLIGSGVLKGVSGMDGPHVYRIPYAIQWIWPIPLAIGVYLAPESPWYLVKRGRNEEAKVSLKRLLTVNDKMPDKEVLASAMLTKIQMTVREEEAVGGGNFRACFKGDNFRRTRIAAFTWLFQSCTGSALMGYSTYFYIQAGLSTSNSFTFSIIMYILGIIGTIGSWFLANRVGRFPIYFGGLCCQFVLLIVVGGLAFSGSSGASWGIGSMLLIFTFIYDLTIGPLCFCIVAEIPNAKLRTKTVMLSRNLYNVSNVIIAVINPYMLNPTAWNWKAKSAFVWAGIALIAIIWAWFDLPETKNRTFAELDVLFHQKVPARKFVSTEVEVFDAGKLMEKIGDEGVKAFVQVKEDAAEPVFEKA